MSECPCGSTKEYEACCGPIISGTTPAPTAEALMRARYSAYVMDALDFIHNSLHPDHRRDHDQAATRRWAEQSTWLGLDVGRTEAGGESDEQGLVEFSATFKEKGVTQVHHELSRFARHDGQWYYVDGEMPKPETVKRDAPKVGRNDPCPCGSGKKYKKCCGAAA